MIPFLADLFRTQFSDPLGILRYTLVRSVGAFVVAFLFVYLLGPRAISWLYRRGMRDRVREYGEFFGRSKAGTPTAGGILILYVGVIMNAVAMQAAVLVDSRCWWAVLLSLVGIFSGVALPGVDPFVVHAAVGLAIFALIAGLWLRDR